MRKKSSVLESQGVKAKQPANMPADTNSLPCTSEFPTPTAQAKAFAPISANWSIYWGSRTVTYLLNTA